MPFQQMDKILREKAKIDTTSQKLECFKDSFIYLASGGWLMKNINERVFNWNKKLKSL